ncbi:MAG: NAD(P)/FAD-dependent oxidoreductase [Verrucomicrobiota bacterium]
MAFPKRLHTARTPLFRSLQRLLKLAHVANGKSKPPVDELAGLQRAAQMNRRDFLKMAGVATAAIGSGSLVTSCATDRSRTAPRVVIVGGGVAGLNAAYQLKRAGVRAEIFEASKRSGGRIYTAHDIMAPGLSTELGGEFIDSGHEEMLALAKEFRLPLIDVHGESEVNLRREAYFFGGTLRSENEAVAAFRPLAGKIAADAEKMAGADFEHVGQAAALDKTSLAEYLSSIGANGWMRDLLEVAFVTEFGRDAGEQSAFNMLSMISADLSKNSLELLGESDERYKIRGGNQRITDELSQRVTGQIHYEQRLVAIRSRNRGFTLTFDDGAKEVSADFVIVTIPFTMLREVDLKIELPAYKKKAIAELGYGDNAKLLLGCKKRVWRELGQSGNIYSDETFQLAWDNSRLQGGISGGLTLYSGGKAALDVGDGTPQEQAKRLRPGIEKAFPGLAEQFNGNVERFHWPTYPFTKAAYACYLPGQWTTIAGAEIKPVGNLFFAGEHCSRDFQGFMNGGAQTGKDAAHSVLKALRKRWMSGG